MQCSGITISTPMTRSVSNARHCRSDRISSPKYRPSPCPEQIKNPLTELSSDQLRDVVNTWFCPTMGHDGVVSALLSPPSPRLSSDDTATWALGERVASLEDAQPGDLIQYWRSVDLARPSGHSAVFLHYDPSTNALTYWSSQRKTNGIGENVEIIDPAVWELHIVRPLVAFHLCKR